MNLADTLKRLLEKRRNQLFDITFEYKTFEDFVSFDSFRKLISRFASSGFISRVSKGVYFVGKIDEDKINEQIIEYYSEDFIGPLYCGESLLYKYGLKSKKPDTTKIFSGKVYGNKNVRAVFIHGSNCPDFYKALIVTFKTLILVDLFDNFDRVSNDDKSNFYIKCGELAKNFNEDYLSLIMQVMKYPSLTYQRLAYHLKQLHIYDGVMEIYEKISMEHKRR